ncbi:DUF5071 domain-containing protein [Flavobacterium sp.]|uniref:DUF5071 domain-containing protein n=1 Tax=Flavobacterium sp. TaxID=239 RepID=UPI0026121616|nr:DUF5071 domain-containing protein [Flavobacterium sp.]
MKRYIPQDKSDVNFFVFLEKMNIDEIKDDVNSLLEWLKDMNWPAAALVSKYLSQYANKIDDEIIQVLRSKDEEWKYSILFSLLLHSNIIPNNKIYKQVCRIYKHPTEAELEAELNELAEDICKKYKIICLE